ncbi:MAG: zf-TFIIB domain-containing protein, partial [Rhodobacterales bacterium]|nr:zf-TFIIB domain-containing protein [Rhodobacterales bacterium]
MRCPACTTPLLVPTPFDGRAQIDRCPKCGGVWLDKGELLLVTRNPWLGRKPEGGMPSGRASPRTGEPLVRARLTDGTAVDLAPEGGGLWLDSATFDTLTGTTWAGPDTRSRPAPPAAAALAALAPLPNLFLRSATTLVFLYALLGAV